MCVLVTGISGFVGSYLAQIVPATGLTLDGKSADLRDLDAVCAAVDAIRVDAVVHLAAQSSVPASYEDPGTTFDVNVRGTLNLLLALRKTGFRGRFLYVGSGDVYGAVPERDQPISEDRSPRPRSPYAASKAAAELICYQWSQSVPFDVMMVRPFNHIGPRQDVRFAVADFARQVARIRQGVAAPRISVGDIDCTRDFTDVRDIVRAYVSVLEKGRNGDTYNVCTGVERSIRSVIEDLTSIAGVSIQYAVDPGRLRPAEQRRMVGSFERLRSQTGWEPRMEFRRTLADILAYWEQQELA